VSDSSITIAAGERADARVRDFVALLKPRVMSLVVFTGLAGLIAAPGHLHPLLAAVAVVCIGACAGAAGAINMWFDRDIDAIMDRTRGRPLPRGRIDPEEAVAFGAVLTLFSVMLMGLAVNWVAAALLALANGFYVFVYTVWLKRRTPHNIVIGGAAGAFPPMIGWAAVTGDVSLASVVLFLIIFMWTPPHFWALSLYREGDYARAGVPMMPLVAGRMSTRRQMVLYTALLVPITLMPTVLGAAGLVYGAGAAVLSGLFLLSATLVLRAGDGPEGDRRAREMFGYSIVYLFLVFTLLMVDPATGPVVELIG
jgi:protoheme IX farnesyltransferase